MPTQDAGADEGYLSEAKNPRQKLERFKRWFDQAHRANDVWRAAAIESRKFVSGDQWPTGDLERLKKARRPMLTINKILPRVLFLEGIQRSQRTEPKLMPFEAGDARSAELMGALYKYAATQTREPVVDSKVFDHKIIDGLAYWKAGWQFDGDLEGELLLEAPDPLAIFPDPNWLDAGWPHAEYVIQAQWFALEDACALWPEHEVELKRSYGEWLSEATSANAGEQFGGGEFVGDSFSGDRTYWDPETQRLRVLEVWYKKRVPMVGAMRNDTQETTLEPERVEMMQRAVEQNPELESQLTFLQLPVTKVCLAHCTGDLVLDDQPSPYKAQVFPIFPTVGFYWWKTPFGIVDPLKDLQRETNRRRSTIIEMVMRAALSGFFNAEDDGARKDDLENYASGIAKVISYKRVKPEEITPPQLPQTLVFLDQAAEKDMDRVSNIHAELLGTTSQRTVSGKAIKARQQSGLVVQEPLLESFRFDKEPVVRFCIELVQQFVSPAKAMRVLGSIAVRQPNGPQAEMMAQMGFTEVRDMLAGALAQRYDVAISAQPYDPSMQQQQLNAIMELVGQFAQYMPPDVIVESLKNAGVLTEDQAMRVLAFAQQRLQMEQMAQAGAAAGGAPPPQQAAPPRAA